MESFTREIKDGSVKSVGEAEDEGDDIRMWPVRIDRDEKRHVRMDDRALFYEEVISTIGRWRGREM